MPWVLIPIVAILVGGIVTIMENRTKQLSLKAGKNDQDYEALKQQMEAQQAALAKRIENLEVIISSQTWETMHDKNLSVEDKKFLLEKNQSELELLMQNLSDEEKVKLLSKQLR